MNATNRSADEHRAKLLQLFGDIRGNMDHVGKCVDLSKELLTECCSRLEELRSQVTEFESIMEETTSNNRQQSLDVNEWIRRRNLLLPDQEIIEEITIEGGEKAANSSSRSEKNNLQNQPKKQKTTHENDEISIVFRQVHDKVTAGPSRETTSNKQAVGRKEVTHASSEIEDPVEMALLKTDGVITPQEFNTFLHLSDQVQDPVQLARISFTKEIKMLYIQLMTFHFHLKVANDDFENKGGTSKTNRDLEEKVRRLIHRFQMEV